MFSLLKVTVGYLLSMRVQWGMPNNLSGEDDAVERIPLTANNIKEILKIMSYSQHC